MVGLSVLPHEEQVILRGMLEKWDYCLRRMFVLKGQSLKSAIGYVRCYSSWRSAKVTVLIGDHPFVDRSLAPGAQVLLKSLTDSNLPPHECIDVRTQVRKLDLKDWALVIRAFDNWPFAPEVSEHRPSLTPLAEQEFDVDCCLVLGLDDSRHV